MDTLKFFMDTHDRERGSFPAGLTEEQFAGFFPQYQEACRQEGVIVVGINVGLADGRAFCLTMAPDSEAVRRAHQRVGLPFDTITEVKAVTPGDLFAAPRRV